MIDLDKRTAANPAGWAEIDRLRAERAELLKALQEIARQELSPDMSVDQQLDGDFEGAYNWMIELARAAIAKAGA